MSYTDTRHYRTELQNIHSYMHGRRLTLSLTTTIFTCRFLTVITCTPSRLPFHHCMCVFPFCAVPFLPFCRARDVSSLAYTQVSIFSPFLGQHGGANYAAPFCCDYMILMAEVTLNISCNRIRIFLLSVDLIFVTSKILPHHCINTPLFLVPPFPRHALCTGHTYSFSPKHCDDYHHNFFLVIKIRLQSNPINEPSHFHTIYFFQLHCSSFSDFLHYIGT